LAADIAIKGKKFRLYKLRATLLIFPALLCQILLAA
jgi:hypothetical protein